MNDEKKEIPQEEAPKAEEAKAEEVKAEEPGTEEPKVEEPKVEEPKAEEPKKDEPKKEEPKPSGKSNGDKLLRLMAEFDNYKKRSVRERESIYTDVRVDTVSRFLPVYDNLVRALAAETADAAYKKGVEMIFTQLMEVFKGLGVAEIEAKGKPFDPNRHNAVMHVEDESVGENTVVEEFQKGFVLGDRVIRFSVVKVAN